MRLLVCFLFLAVLTPISADEEGSVDALSSDLFDFYFTSAQLQTNAVVLVRSAEDLSFSFQRGVGKATPCPAGSTITLPLGQTGKLFNDASSFRFIPFPLKAGQVNLFLLEEENMKGDIHVGLLRSVARPVPGRTTEVISVWAHSQDELRQIEKDIAVGKFVNPSP